MPAPGLSFDPALARKDLASAKAELGAVPEKLVITTNDVPTHVAIAKLIAKNWNRILGIRVEVEVLAFAQHLQRVRAGDFDIARMGILATHAEPLEEFLSALRCGADDNYAYHCNPRFDEHVQAATLEPKLRKRLGLIGRSELTLLSSAAVIPLFFYRQARLRRRAVRDLPFNIADNPTYRWADIQAERSDSEDPKSRKRPNSPAE